MLTGTVAVIDAPDDDKPPAGGEEADAEVSRVDSEEISFKRTPMGSQSLESREATNSPSFDTCS